MSCSIQWGLDEYYEAVIDSIHNTSDSGKREAVVTFIG